MTFYCIKHIPTGKIIPCANGRMDRGGSWVEPTDFNKEPPRIFTEKRYAKGWLTSWLKGAYTTTYTTDYESGYEEPQIDLVPKPHRKREEYKIVSISFRIGT